MLVLLELGAIGDEPSRFVYVRMEPSVQALQNRLGNKQAGAKIPSYSKSSVPEVLRYWCTISVTTVPA